MFGVGKTPFTFLKDKIILFLLPKLSKTIIMARGRGTMKTLSSILIFGFSFVSLTYANQIMGWHLTKKVNIGNNPYASLVWNDHIYISQLGPNRTPVEDDDGQLIRLELDGTIDQSFRLTQKLNHPTGLSIENGILYIGDLNKLYAISTLDGEILFDLDLQEAAVQQITDIEFVAPGILAVADVAKKLVLVDVYNKEPLQEVANIESYIPNALAFNPLNSTLYVTGNLQETNVASNGAVLAYKYDPKTNKFAHSATKSIGYYLDGIQVYNSKVYVSDWGPAAAKSNMLELVADINEPGHKTTELFNTAFADFSIYAYGNIMVTPDSINGDILIYNILF